MYTQAEIDNFICHAQEKIGEIGYQAALNINSYSSEEACNEEFTQIDELITFLEGLTSEYNAWTDAEKAQFIDYYRYKYTIGCETVIQTTPYLTTISGGGCGFRVIEEQDNRVITSRGEGLGGIAEANLTFDGNTLSNLGTGAILMASGTTAQRPTAINGMIRYNTTTSKIEGYESSTWKNVITGGVGATIGENELAYGNAVGDIISSPGFTYNGTNAIGTTGYFQWDNINIDGNTINVTSGTFILSIAAASKLILGASTNVTYQSFIPNTSGSLNLGGPTAKFDEAYMVSAMIGTGTSFNSEITGTFTANRVATLPDKTGILAMTSDVIPTTTGGTGLTSYTTGDIPYASATNVLSKLAAGTNGYVLTMSGGIPTWAAAVGSFSVSNEANNRLITSVSAGTGNAEANLTFDGSVLRLINTANDLSLFLSSQWAKQFQSSSGNLQIAATEQSSGNDSGAIPVMQFISQRNSGLNAFATRPTFSFYNYTTKQMELSASGGLSLFKTTNQLVLGTTNTTTISATAPATSRVYTIPDVGGSADFVLTSGGQTISGAKVFSDDVEINDSSKGVILKSPDSTRWRLTVDNTGALITTSL